MAKYATGKTLVSWKNTALNAIVDRFPTWLHPNHLTVLRAFLIAPIGALLWYDHINWGVWLFIIAVLTDPLDGALARRRHQITREGKILDPGTDKLLLYVILFTLGWKMLPHSILWTMFILDMLYVIIGLLVYVYQEQLHLPVLGSNIWGKWKLGLQVFGVLALFLSLWRPNLIYASVLLFAFAIVATILAFEKDIVEAFPSEKTTE